MRSLKHRLARNKRLQLLKSRVREPFFSKYFTSNNCRSNLKNRYCKKNPIYGIHINNFITVKTYSKLDCLCLVQVAYGHSISININFEKILVAIFFFTMHKLKTVEINYFLNIAYTRI